MDKYYQLVRDVVTFLDEEEKIPKTNILEEIKKTLQKTSSIIETPLDDSLAKEVATQWQLTSKIAEITFFLFDESKQEQIFLKNVAKALEAFFPTSFINAKTLNKHELQTLLSSKTLKLAIGDKTEAPFFPLKASSYLKNPLLKKELWEKLKACLHQ